MTTYISIIQLCLLLQFSLVCFCELTPLFAHTFKSVLLRGILGLSLLTLGYYSQFLITTNYSLLLSVFAVTVITTALAFKYLGIEFSKRYSCRQSEKYNLVHQTESNKTNN